MKKILIASILLNICCFLNAQFIPEVGDVLEYKSTKDDGISSYDTTFALFVERDTLVNNQICKKMSSTFHHCNKPFVEAYVYEKDSVVYFTRKDDLSFDTLFDFTKKKNEHWRINLPNNHYVIVQVDSVYQTILEGKVYKTLGVTYFHFENIYQTDKFFFANEYCSIIIEQFGDIYYYFNLISKESDCLGEYVNLGLSQFITSQSDMTGLSNIGLSCRPNLMNSIQKKNIHSLSFEIYPSSAKDEIFIYTQESEINFSEIKLLSLSGVEYPLNISKTNVIDVSDLASDMYLIKIEGQTLKFFKE
jgi:hypothetical protein